MGDEEKSSASTFKPGDAVELRESLTTTRGIVVRVNDDGFVTVKWLIRFSMLGKTSVHRARDLRKLPAYGGVP